MSIHVIGVVVLVLVFVIGTLRPVNIGALALIATFLIGTLVADESVKELLAGFPADLFVLLVGVTYLFGLAAVNGTIEWLIDHAVGLLGDRPVLVPWLIFAFSAVPTTAGALGPAGVAMLAPLCLRLGERYGIDRRMSALMVMHGSCLGNFSPLNGLAVIVRQALEDSGLSVSAAALFFGNAAYNVGLAVVIYLLFGGRKLWHERGMRVTAMPDGDITPEDNPDVDSADGATGAGGGVAVRGAAVRTPLRPDQAITLAVIVAVAVGALVFNLEIGFLALIAAALLHMLFPDRFAKADRQIVWTVVLLICGVVTLVAAMQRYGTVDVPHDVRLGHQHGRHRAGPHLADLPTAQRAPVVTGDVRELVATASRILAAAGHDDLVWGHASVRDPGGKGVWIKSAEWGLGEVTPARVHLVDTEGTVLSGDGVRHSEYPIHTEIMAARPDVGGVVHTHPPHAVALAASGQPLWPVSHAATYFVPPEVPRFTDTADLVLTRDLGRAVARTLGDARAMFLVNHGIVAVGETLQAATVAAVLLERACAQQLLTHAAGGWPTWSDPEESLAKRAHIYHDRAVTAVWNYLARQEERQA